MSLNQFERCVISPRSGWTLSAWVKVSTPRLHLSNCIGGEGFAQRSCVDGLSASNSVLKCKQNLTARIGTVMIEHDLD